MSSGVGGSICVKSGGRTEEEVVDEAQEDGLVVRGDLGRVEVPVRLYVWVGQRCIEPAFVVYM